VLAADAARHSNTPTLTTLDPLRQAAVRRASAAARIAAESATEFADPRWTRSKKATLGQ
jgi:hypothetical protein